MANITLVYFWKIPRKRILWALIHMGLDRIFLQRSTEISFWKLLGTGKGETFTPKDANLRRWGLLIVLPESEIENFDASSLILRWRKTALSEFRILLAPISAHGQWSGKTPFVNHVGKSELATPRIVAITRARIKWQKNLIFWRAVPAVTESLHQSSGLVAAIGIGEAPLGLQGTFSLWESARDLKNFAYQGAAHQEVIEATARENWYSEELFSRFAVIQERGSL